VERCEILIDGIEVLLPRVGATTTSSRIKIERRVRPARSSRRWALVPCGGEPATGQSAIRFREVEVVEGTERQAAASRRREREQDKMGHLGNTAHRPNVPRPVQTRPRPGPPTPASSPPSPDPDDRFVSCLRLVRPLVPTTLLPRARHRPPAPPRGEAEPSSVRRGGARPSGPASTGASAKSPRILPC